MTLSDRPESPPGPMKYDMPGAPDWTTSTPAQLANSSIVAPLALGLHPDKTRTTDAPSAVYEGSDRPGTVQQTTTATLSAENASNKPPPGGPPAATTANDLGARSSHRGDRIC